ncbi:crotonase/enoyl-CoA hydratase family protein [Antrihabitans stalactiti]|uniref:Crotonase/enoyl-CoA hydratase family protein n=1 Tax=Antrihabitans stalactiti TaxID=2584121 RepID=A0A848KCW3_9NOCA|nr:crotonase/enoyl-CoA hydratase family protein [Antrihabitans stalactiti]
MDDRPRKPYRARRTALTVELSDNVATVTLIGPGKGNAMGPAFWEELPEVFSQLDADHEVAAIVLVGSGKHFSVGLDLAAMSLSAPVLADSTSAERRMTLLNEIRRLQAAVTSVAECRKPVIAAVHGWCIGGGLDLIAAVDIRYASADAKFSLREAKVAIVADIGSLQRLPAIIGDGHLRELAFTGKDIDAERAQQIGLVNAVFDDAATTLANAHETARAIAANPSPVGLKDVLGRERVAVIADGLKYVSAWNAAFLPSEDLTEAIRGVLEKRAPQFKGR